MNIFPAASHNSSFGVTSPAASHVSCRRSTGASGPTLRNCDFAASNVVLDVTKHVGASLPVAHAASAPASVAYPSTHVIASGAQGGEGGGFGAASGGKGGSPGGCGMSGGSGDDGGGAAGAGGDAGFIVQWQTAT